MRKIRWGVLSTAKIGIEKVLPAMQHSELCTIAAIASRRLPAAQVAASRLGIAQAYGSYTVYSFFSYYNADPANIRNQADNRNPIQRSTRQAVPHLASAEWHHRRDPFRNLRSACDPGRFVCTGDPR